MKLKHNSINYSVNTIDDLLNLNGMEENDVTVVADENRGGTFVYRSAEKDTNNGGTVFNGWVRQYDGAVNVKWFGAEVNTDSTEAIQNAFDSLNDGDTLVLDEVYHSAISPNLSKHIDYSNKTYFPWNSGGILPGILVENKNNITITGKGGLSILEYTDEVQLNTVIAFKNCNNVTITNISILGHDDTYTNQVDIGIVSIGDTDYTSGNRSEGLVVNNVTFDKVHSSPLFVYMTDNVSITNNKYNLLRGVANDIMFCSSLNLSNNLCKGAYEFCDLDKYVENVTLNSNTILFPSNSDGDAAIELNGTRKCTIQNNIIDGAFTTGILIAAKKEFGDQVLPDADTQVLDVTISGNTVSNCLRGIYIPNYNVGLGGDYEYDVERCTISDNIINTTIDTCAISLAGIDITCSGNIIKSANGNGIQTNSPGLKNAHITDNNILSSGENGIYISHSSIYSRITNNTVKFSNKEGNPTSSTYGIFITEATDSIISNNINYENAVDVGIRIQGYSGTANYGQIINNVSNLSAKFTDSIINQAYIANNKFDIIDFNTNQKGANIFYGNSQPSGSSSTYTTGAIVFNTSPSAGGTIGWVCVSAGSPGAWKPFGIINSNLVNLDNIENNTLPTTDPGVAGQLWNNNGVVTVSAG